MLDKSGKICIKKELIDKSILRGAEKVEVYYDNREKMLVLEPCMPEDYYFVATVALDEKGRIVIPQPIRKAFPNATFLPTRKKDYIYIHIIDH